MEKTTSDFTMERPEVGGWETIIACPVYQDGREITPIGTFGDYKVQLTFGPSKYQFEHVNVSFHTGGDSFIQFRNPELNDPTQVVEVRFDAHGPNAEHSIARAVCNTSGRMSKIIFDKLSADNRVHAESIAYVLISPVVSWISFAYDIPLEIVQITTTELSTGMTATTMWISPKIKGLDQRFQLPKLPHNPQFLECIGQYREGLSTTNDFYSFLCFWKVYEGIVNIRQKLDKYIAKNKLQDLPSRDKTVRDDQDIRDTHPHLIGKKLGHAHEHFKKTTRDSIAHLDTVSGTYVSAHNLKQLNEIRRGIPVTRKVA